MTEEQHPVCLHSTRDLLWNGVLSRCRDCGLVITARVPQFEYAQDYFVEGGKGYDFDSPHARAFDGERFERELDALEAQGLRGRVLDVGCAVGTFLAHARARGWTVAGVELADFARAEAGRRLGIEVAASLDALPPDARFDVVTLHHVLEHLEDPVRFLADEVAPRVERLLLIEVPNFASLGAQMDGLRWKDLRPEQHVHHFEPATLRAVVASSGFEVVRVYTLAEPLWSVRVALRTLRTLRALTGPSAARPVEAASTSSAPPAEWQPRRGVRGFATKASRLAFLPLVRWIERTQRGERLVLEARPPAQRS